MQTRWLLGLIAILSLGAVAAHAGGLARDRRVVLPAAQVPKLVRQCSRRHPGPVNGTWTPSQAQLDALETALPKVFAENLKRVRGGRLSAGTDPDTLLARYYRQYAGLVIGGRRVIYLNAFATPHGAVSANWRRKPMIVCDGGTITFGVEYDPERRRFVNFAFNGSLRSPRR